MPPTTSQAGKRRRVGLGFLGEPVAVAAKPKRKRNPNPAARYDRGMRKIWAEMPAQEAAQMKFDQYYNSHYPTITAARRAMTYDRRQISAYAPTISKYNPKTMDWPGVDDTGLNYRGKFKVPRVGVSQAKWAQLQRGRYTIAVNKGYEGTFAQFQEYEAAKKAGLL